MAIETTGNPVFFTSVVIDKYDPKYQFKHFLKGERYDTISPVVQLVVVTTFSPFEPSTLTLLLAPPPLSIYKLNAIKLQTYKMSKGESYDEALTQILKQEGIKIEDING